MICAIRAVGEYLKQWGLRRKNRSSEPMSRTPKVVQYWLDEGYPDTASRIFTGRIHPIPIEGYPTPAQRPINLRVEKDQIKGVFHLIVLVWMPLKRHVQS